MFTTQCPISYLLDYLTLLHLMYSHSKTSCNSLHILNPYSLRLCITLISNEILLVFLWNYDTHLLITHISSTSIIYLIILAYTSYISQIPFYNFIPIYIYLNTILCFCFLKYMKFFIKISTLFLLTIINLLSITNYPKLLLLPLLITILYSYTPQSLSTHLINFINFLTKNNLFFPYFFNIFHIFSLFPQFLYFS